ncbi:uncharacterized protein LOC143914695 [Arctopsyche grandis]|uniref:uncharacterized protein LOC143914695 n=1 Tax=Arctopsyche grandis TaxID=121162 RepID=UPI00406D8776
MSARGEGGLRCAALIWCITGFVASLLNVLYLYSDSSSTDYKDTPIELYMVYFGVIVEMVNLYIYYNLICKIFSNKTLDIFLSFVTKEIICISIALFLKMYSFLRFSAKDMRADGAFAFGFAFFVCVLYISFWSALSDEFAKIKPKKRIENETAAENDVPKYSPEVIV